MGILSERPRTAVHRNSQRRPQFGLWRPVAAIALATICAWPLATLLTPGHAAVGAQPKPVHEVKAALVYRVAIFVQWPESAFENEDSPIRIAIVGDGDLYQALSEIVRDKRIDGRPVEVVRGDGKERFHDYHVVYVDSRDSRSTATFVRNQEDAATLTVGDSDDFCERGGMIRFFENDRHRLSVEVNVDAAERAGLKISSKLLNLATIYHESS